MRITVATIGLVAAFVALVTCAFSADANVRMCTVGCTILIMVNAHQLGVALADR